MYIELHKRILPPGLDNECIAIYNCNPYSEYDKHPVLKREIEMGVEMILSRNQDLKSDDISHFFWNESLTFYLGERV